MPTISHKNLTGNQLHEPKGVAAAAVDKVYVSDGAGSGAWQKIEMDQLDATVAPWALLRTQSASASSTIDFVHGASGVVLDNTYDRYMLTIDNAVVSADDTVLHLRIGTGGGPTYDTGSVYSYSLHASNDTVVASSSATFIIMTAATGTSIAIGNASGESYSGTIEFNNPESTTLLRNFAIRSWYNRASDGGLHSLYGGGTYQTIGTALSAIRITPSSGNIASGSFSLYGLRK